MLLETDEMGKTIRLRARAVMAVRCATLPSPTLISLTFVVSEMIDAEAVGP